MFLYQLGEDSPSGAIVSEALKKCNGKNGKLMQTGKK